MCAAAAALIIIIIIECEIDYVIYNNKSGEFGLLREGCTRPCPERGANARGREGRRHSEGEENA